MKQTKFTKLIMPMLLLFFIANVIIILTEKQMKAASIDYTIVSFANILFFVLGLISLGLHAMASKKENPNVLFRSIMGSTFIKMIVTGTAVLIYAKTAKEKTSTIAVLIGMALYLAYMAIEVKTALQLNKKQKPNASN